MAASPVKFLFGFLLISITLWLVFIFASRLVAWILSRIVGASVGFRVGGWKCLRDVVVKFNKGVVESVSIGEIRLSLRQSLVKLGVGFISRDPKVQVLICDIEVVIRPSSQGPSKAKTRRSSGSGRGKWMVVANIARYLSVCVTDLVVKTPRATVEVKELEVDISKDGGSNSNLFVKLNILPILVHIGEPRVSWDHLSDFNGGGCISSGQASVATTERSSAPFSCESLSLSCEFGHDREVGIVIKNVDVSCGEVAVNLNEQLLSKTKRSQNTSLDSDRVIWPSVDSTTAKKLQKKQEAVAALSKYTSMFPEKVCFNLPKLDVIFVHCEHGLFVENNIMGIELKSIKSRSTEDVGESTRLDVQMDFSEIHLLREAGSSVLEILKVDIVSLVYVPVQPISPIRAEVDIKLGGTQCNIIMSTLKPWLRLQLSKKKRMVPQDEASNTVKPQPNDTKAIMWTCTVSAPEMTIVLFNIGGMPVYHGCSQSSHLFANNISNKGTAVHMELGELNLHMQDEYQDCLKESLFRVESNSGSILHIAKVSLDWGKKDLESSEEDGPRRKLVLSVDVSGMGVYLTFKRVESLISTAISIQALLKSLSASGKKATQRRGRSSKPSGKGTQLLKFNLQRCSVNFCAETGLENTVVPDPKRVNYGSQGGQVIISVSADGTPRCANILSTVSNECQKLKYSISLDIFHLSLCVNKEKQSTQMELERARSFYQEYLEEHRPVTKVAMFDLQNAKLVRRSGGLKEISVCSLFSATDIAVRWEPDVHLSLVELVLQLKLLVHNLKLQEHGTPHMEYMAIVTGADQKKEADTDPGRLENHKKKESIFAVDVEVLSISAELGDGVDALVQVQSIFSENARIGVLLEGLILSFNGSRIFKSSRMQISRIPSVSRTSDAIQPVATTWDWVIQGLDIHICMPYRLQLRAIDDCVEDMLRALKLITAAKTDLIFPTKKDISKLKKPSSMRFGCIKFCIRKLTADIEEEPIQGWLDEHYQLMKKEARELAVRLSLLDDSISKVKQCPKAAEINNTQERLNYCNGEVDVQDSTVNHSLREEIYKQSFRSYYHACQNLVLSEGSGACREDFQSGFKPSTARTSLLSISATDLDVSLTRIDGGNDGMVDVLKKLDPVCLESNIPFSRLYGRNILLNTASLVVQLRNYTFPLFSGSLGKCNGCLVLAQQATCFQPQIYHDVFVGKWRKVRLLRSASGTTPPMKTYSNLPIHFQKGEVSFGVGYEPAFADISYAFTVALRRANLSVRNPGPLIQPPKKERSLPWWDDMRNYIHGNVSLFFSESQWSVLATTDPYEKLEKLQIVSGSMELQQSDGRIYVSAKDFKILVSSLESLANDRGLKLPTGVSGALLEAPVFTLGVTMDWECESGNPMNHYLFALPIEGKPHEKVFDPFRSTSLSLRWNFSLRPSLLSSEKSTSITKDGVDVDVTISNPHKSENVARVSPTLNLGAHDLAWLIKFWNMNYFPPHKLRMFSRWPRFGVPRVARSGNLSLDKVMTEFMVRIDATPACIKHMPLDDDDPAKGLTFTMTKLKQELCYSRGKQKYTFESKRDILDLVYQGLDLHIPKAFLSREHRSSVAKVVQMTRKSSQSASMERIPGEKGNYTRAGTEKNRDDGFLLSSDYFTIRRQAPKADPARLLAWQEAGRRNLEMTYVRSEFENGSETDEHTRSDPSDDDGYNVVIADNCQRVFVYGLKLLWNIENRNAVWSWVGGISKAFEPPKPSPSRQYAQRKLLEEKKLRDGAETHQDDDSKPLSSSDIMSHPSTQHVETSGSVSSPAHSVMVDNLSPAKNGNTNDSAEGTRHFMVNVIEPQFNLHSEDANGRFLLAAVSGRVLARSFHSVLHVGYEMIEQTVGTTNVQIPEMTWKRMEFSVMLEQVQAHVAPTDVDPGAGLQWLPEILRSSPKVKRTGALLERVFMPCDMYFRYTRHKGGTPELKVKPLKELAFNSHNITATMTSRQFQVMLDVLTNLLFARLPKPRKSSLSFPAEDDEDIEEEADEVVPDGVEEVELAKVNLEQKERERKLLLDDIRKLSLWCDSSGDLHSEKEGDLWMVAAGKSMLVQGLKRELINAQKSRKAASASLRMALQKAAQLRLMEKEKNKSPSYAMRISLQINKVVWSMLVDGKSFAEAEINDMIYDFDRDYKDVGVAQFTTKYFVVRNCLYNAKSDMLLSAWNPPPEWGKKVMLRVDAKQGAPKDGNSPLELFQVEIYPLKIHLTETMYRMMWEYFFPEDEQDSQRRQEVWKVSTTAGARRLKKGSSIHEPSASNSHSTKESDGTSKIGAFVQADSAQASKLQNSKANAIIGSIPELRRTSSFDRTWEETVAESVANELVLQGISSSKTGQLGNIEQDESSKNKPKDSKLVKAGRLSHEEKKVTKSHDEKRSRPRKMMEFYNIKISQVELLVTYEGSRFVVSELKLLMDTFHRVEFTGTWRRLFSRVKKHIIWGVLKSVTGMQGKKFKDKAHSQPSGAGVPDIDLNFSDNEGQTGKSDPYPPSWPKRPSDGAGDGFVTSIRGLFNTQRRKAKAFVLRTMRGEPENDFQGDWSESDAEFSPFARQLTITKAKRLLRRHTKKFRSRGQKGSSSQQRESLPSSPRETTPFDSDYSSGSSPYEDFHE
ncbi:Golgi-body localization protein domain isoform 1 [Quillaja saponaria]|uniref:Golgi-body localization protein domain isoform 1 n=1 Tax=Quillaja saponaria TaxID=32244 RepID=A0AAD7LX11_QUISA|nr:Golgi-body localization protein domain isoform 1 [Quillaja saponaria]